MPNIEDQCATSCLRSELVTLEPMLTLAEVLALARVSYQTILRWRNAGIFPEAHNGKGKKLLWTKSAIEMWMNQQQSALVSIPQVTTPKERRQFEKSYQERQEAARAALDRHRKGKVK